MASLSLLRVATGMVTFHDPRPVSLKSSLSNYYDEIRCACYTAPHKIKFLGLFPDEEYRRLLPFLELVDMPLGQVIHEPVPVTPTLFPCNLHRGAHI